MTTAPLTMELEQLGMTALLMPAERRNDRLAATTSSALCNRCTRWVAAKT
jgi:hypothetical protein